MNEQNASVNREYKSDVFKMYFSRTKELLELYNALNGTNYTEEAELSINTLDQAIYLKIYNDVSFVLRETVNLYEHQSSVNKNMPLRDLFYICDIYKAEALKGDLYGYKTIELPTPKFVVFYNGTDNAPESQILKLSDAYKESNESPELELTVKVLNINYGHNKALMDKCKALRDYSIFVHRVRDNLAAGMPIEEAVETAIDRCIKDHVMEDFLTKEKAGVIQMHILDFDEEKHNKSLIEEGIEEGRKEERANTERERANAEKERKRATSAN